MRAGGGGRKAAWAGLVSSVAAALTAVLLWLASPPHDLWPLAWLAPAPLFWAVLRGSGAVECAPGDAPAPSFRPGFSAGFLAGFLFLLLLVPWFGAFSPAGYPVAAAVWGLLFGLAFGACGRLLHRVPSTWAPPVLASTWTVLEWMRAQGPLAFPWGTLSVTQYRNLPVLQVLDLCGAYGLSFLMALGAATLAAAATPRFSRPGLRWSVVALAVAGIVTLRGAWILRRPEPGARSARVAVVQSSESHAAPGAAVVCVSRFWEYADRTREAVRHSADLVLWPESACEDDAVHDPYVQDRLRELIRGTRSHLLVGSFVLHPASDMMTNSAVLMEPGGRVRGQYAKVLIVPFGEYLPARPLLAWTERLGMPSQDLRAGEGWSVLEWAGGRIGVSICFESAFGYVSRAFVNRGASLLAVLTSDGWAGRTAAGLQHAAFAPLRAVETRRSVARAAATGVSQLIDPYGRPVRSIPMFRKGIALARLPLRQDLTLYARLGDWPVALSWLVLLAAALRRRKE